MNTEVRSDLAHSYVLVGDALAATGDLAGALEHYRRSLAAREALTAADPAATQRRYEVAVSLQRIGDTLGNPGFPNLGDTAGALESYRTMLMTFEDLSTMQPTNARMRHSLSIGYEKIGDVLAATHDAVGALASYREALAIRDELSLADPTNAAARRDLARIYGDIGDVLVVIGDQTGALESYHTSLAIFEALSTSDPTNMGLHQALVGMQHRLDELSTPP